MRINGHVMSKDTIIATAENGSVTEINESLVPFRLRGGDIEGWLSSRAIDRHRTNSRLLKKALRLSGAEDAEVALKFNAATITDSYWFRPEGSDLKYDDIRFTFNNFDKLALFGDLNSANNPDSRTPELTNIGSFEKCWRLEDGAWWLYKQGNSDELFSEFFICKLGCKLGFDMAEYRLDSGYIKSLDFTGGASVNFEAAEGFMAGNEDYDKNFSRIYEMSPEFAEQYLRIIYLDTLVFNFDRHTQNYGVLRDVESGKVLGMAPNFDNNIALLARGGLRNTDRKNDKLIELFIKLLHTDPRAGEMAAKLPAPTEKMVKECAHETGIDVDYERACAIVLNGYTRISEGMNTI